MSYAALSVKDLSIRFSEDLVFENLNFDVPMGHMVAILGPNGSGKSCLIKALVGLLAPATGSISLAGKPIGQVSPEQVGYVPQVKTLDRSFPGRVIELVASGINKRWPWHVSEADKAKAATALSQVGALHLAEKQLKKLSGGELQRVYLARCLAGSPRFIFLDEPATGVDVTLVNDLNRLLGELQRRHQITIVMVTHDMDVAYSHANWVLLLNQTAIAYGPPKTTMTQENLRRTFGHGSHFQAFNPVEVLSDND